MRWIPYYHEKLRGYQFWLTLLEVLVFIAVPFYGINDHIGYSLSQIDLEGFLWPFFCVIFGCYTNCQCTTFLTLGLLGLMLWGAIIIPISLGRTAAGLAMKARKKGTSLVPSLVLTLGESTCFCGVILYLFFSTFSYSNIPISPFVLMILIFTHLSIGLSEFAQGTKSTGMT